MLGARLTLAQWLSPAFPTGAFAASHGLEVYIADGRVRDGAAFEAWLSDTLTFGAGWQDAVLISMVLRGEASAAEMADIARALAAGAERLSETTDQGNAFARAAAVSGAGAVSPAPMAVAFAEAAAPLGLPVAEVIALYLHAFAANLTSVATRAVPLGQTDAQSRLYRMAPMIEDIATRAAAAGLADLGSAALAGDIASLRHETLETRLYRT